MYLTYLILTTTIIISILAFDRTDMKERMMLNPYDIVQHKKWYRSFTHGFIHADFIHLALNCYVLFMFGVQGKIVPGYQSSFVSVEPQFIDLYGLKGYFYFFLLYVGGILFSSLYTINKHQNDPYYNALGASGAVSAVVFACIILNPNAQLGLIILPGIYLPAYIFGPLLLFGEYYMAKRGGTNIGHDAHISGAIYGLIFMGLLDYNHYINFFKAIFS